VTERPESVTLIAIYQFVTGTILLLFSCLLAAAAFPAFLFTVGRAEDVLLVTVLGAGALALLITLGAASFAVGWGLLRMRRWARLGAIVLAVFALIGFPVWTIAAAFVLIYLIGPEGRTAFGLTPLDDEPALETEPHPEPEVVSVPEARSETHPEPVVEPAEPAEPPEPEAWPEPEERERPPAPFTPARPAHSARPKRRPGPTDDVSGPRRIITPRKRVFGTQGGVDSDAESTRIMDMEHTRHLPVVERDPEGERTRRVEPAPDDETVVDEPRAEDDRPGEERRQNG
jgi:hypothetical protein